MNTNYKPNSYKYREQQANGTPNEEPTKAQKVVNGTVTRKEKTGLAKFTSSLITDDMNKIKNYTISDILIPTIKKALVDIITNGAYMFFYGENRRDSNPNRPGFKVSYGDYFYNKSNNAGTRRDPREPAAPRSAYDYEDIVLTNRGDAEVVLDSMDGIIARYGFVRVPDLYDLVGVTMNNHCANNYGWTDLSTAKVVRVTEGYILKLPKAMPLD